MSADQPARRSRRQILSSAASAAAGAVAATFAAAPGVEAAAFNLQAETTNNTTALTRIDGTGGINTLMITSDGSSSGALNVHGGSDRAISAASNGLYAVFAMGSSAGTIPLYGANISTGIAVGGISIGGTGVVAASGSNFPVAQPDTALYATVDAPTKTGLKVDGRVVLANRSGRKLIPAGASSVVIPAMGVRAGNFAVATLATARTGRWVRAATCGTDKVTVYLNGALTTATYVSWIVLG